MAPRQKRGRSPKRNRREELLRAAIQVFDAKGYPRASIQDVADGVGMLKGSLYHYIDSKEDLLARIFEESDAQSFALIEEVKGLDISAVERVRVFARSWSLWYLQNVERASIYVKDWKHLTGERRKRALEKRRAYEASLEEIIEAVQREGNAAPGLDTRLACFFVLAAINGLPAWYRRKGEGTPEQIATAYGDLIVAAICGSADYSGLNQTIGSIDVDGDAQLPHHPL
jgi:TetR/AcrR family transcriptional regulator, cholesterol catabolism regulator